MRALGGGAGRGPLRLLTVIGTRPEVIKMAPVAAAAVQAGLVHATVSTGQHQDLFDQALAEFGLAIDHRLEVGASGGDVAAQAARVEAAMLPLLAEARPDVLLVQGDTTSAYAAARAGAAANVTVAHVEAGLRSGDLAQPWPEEGNRIAIDALATLLFPPTEGAAANLRREPAVTGTIHVTGNTGIDALLAMRARIDLPSQETERRLVVVTAHRRENHGAPFADICAAVLALAERDDVEIAFPVHPNPAVRMEAEARLGGHESVRLLPPLGYREMVALLDRAHLLLTDSGGLQEEAPALGLPTLVLRNVTERPEALATGNLRLVGTDAARIVAEAARLLDDRLAHATMSRPAFPYGDGRAAERIVTAIQAHFARAGQPG